ncbi:polyphosphate polymerase domain-containing protein [Streptococcus saliviloxodontae]|uniref:SPX domain protein involved in polyphosphate accumulation n=1 Tax=Streptococcus saliviloxodontae TaxID=1349416 RepID=A0ABS2PLU5_9STRE|nr:polyphosphate polymerase domain-containing protein [Streptococcus saliviloxodontae]MBM7636257.1 SPX domain protein involved in polyphosphate accumulation [Streptococcus saliviloxodontae]
MTKPLETRFKRIESKYVVPKDLLPELLEDLRHYLVEDDYPRSTISNVYFDNDDFEVIQDAMAHRNGREKLRMRTYEENPTEASQVFLEIKKKDQDGVGHKYRMVATQKECVDWLLAGSSRLKEVDPALAEEIASLHERYGSLKPIMFISYNRFSMKEKQHIKGQGKVRVTIDQDLVYRDKNVSLLEGRYGNPLLDEDYVIMEVKSPGEQPQWLEDILNTYGLTRGKFSKYSTAYRKSRGIASLVSER